MLFPEQLRYSSEHEWVAVEDTRARVGITDYAQDALGDVVYVDLPDPGLAVIAGSTCAEVESTKSVSEIYTPLSGVIVEVNQALVDAPEHINQEPYGRGWIFVVEMSEGAAGSVHSVYCSLAGALIAGLTHLGVEAAIARHAGGGARPGAGPVCLTSMQGADLRVRDRKLCGSAQARRGGAVLQHGSILL